MKKILLFVIMSFFSVNLFPQIAGTKVFIEMIDTDGRKVLMTRPVPVNTKEWEELTNTLIGIIDTYRDGMMEIKKENEVLTKEIKNLTNINKDVDDTKKDIDNATNATRELEKELRKKRFMPKFTAFGGYTFMGKDYNLYSVGLGLSWFNIGINVLPGLAVFDGNIKFGISFLLSYTF